MVDDELPPSVNPESVYPPGPRRATYTPPPAPKNYDTGATDDDALAGALSDDFQRWAPPTGPIVTSALATSPALPSPPRRVSLTDEQLVDAADLDAPGRDTGALLDLVERELALRQTEVRTVARWEQEVRAAGVPEVDELVSQVRLQFTGVIPVVASLPAASQRAPDDDRAVPIARDATIAERLAVAPPPTLGELSPAAAQPMAPLPAPGAPVPAASPATTPVAPSAIIAPVEGAVEALIEPAARPPVEEALIAGPTSIEALLAGTTTASADGLPATSTPVTSTPVTSTPVTSPPAALPFFDPPALLDPAVIEPSDSSRTAFDELLAESVVDDSEVTTNTAPPPSSSLGHDLVVAPRVTRVEVSAAEPTVAQQRAGRSIRLFWLWFAVNASVVSVALGAAIVGLGVSLRQAVLAALIGVAMSFLPLGLGTLAGKWSGQPTMIVSRATFGTRGNVLPALLAVITRVAWAAALLWMLAVGVAEVLLGAGLVDAVFRVELTIAVAALGLALTAVIAGFGFGMIAIVNAIVSILSSVLVVGLIVLTAPYVDVTAALSIPDGDWVLMVSGAVLVFSVVGLAWANSSGDLARYQSKATYGSSAVLYTAFGATIPAFLLISWGAILAASTPVVGGGLQSNPIDLIFRMLPLWYPAPLIAAVSLGLIAAAAVALYSGGFALLATGLRSSRPISVVIAVVLTGAVATALLLVVTDVSALFRDAVTTLAVPVAAWAGIFGAETMIRTRRVHSPSLLEPGGVYPAVRWINLAALVLITAVGWGLSTATVPGLQWQGYLFTLLGVDTTGSLATSDPGVFVAIVLGLLTPLIAGIPALSRLQAAERAAGEADGTLTVSGHSADPVTAESEPTTTTTPASPAPAA